MNRLLPFIAGSLLFCIAGGVHATGPSFDCAKASQKVERLICKDADLATLDRQMADLYASLWNSIPKDRRQNLKAEQIAWLRTRTDCGSSRDARRCVADAFTSRISELTSTAKGSNSRPKSSVRRSGPITEKDFNNPLSLLGIEEDAETEAKATNGAGEQDSSYNEGYTEVPNTVFGDLNGDGINDGAAIIVNNTGGSGRFTYLVSLIAGNKGTFGHYLGDRTEVQSLAISGGRIVVTALVAGPNDGLINPTVKKTLTYTFKNGNLVANQRWKPIL